MFTKIDRLTPSTTRHLRPLVLPQRRARLAAAEVAQAYVDVLSAQWRGDGEGADFFAWLGACQVPRLPPAPARAPDAISPHAAGGRIRWYDVGPVTLGYVPGEVFGYAVPRAADGVNEGLTHRRWGGNHVAGARRAGRRAGPAC